MIGDKMPKKKTDKEYIPYSMNENIHVYYELEYLKDVMKPGDRIKFKNTRGEFLFILMAHNSEKDVTWIDCRNPTTGEYRSFYVEKLSGLVRAKKSRRKKQLVR
jgi:hypothetical protein